MRANSVIRHQHIAVLEAKPDLVREETLDGRKYIVAPVVALREGVHNNEYISYDEIVPIYADAWAGRPLVIDHPVDSDGNPVTANSTAVYQSSRVGFLFNVVARDDIRGISGELWIDMDKSAEVPGGTETLRKIQAGENLEVSTGYFTIIDRLPGEWRNPKDGKIEKFTSSQFQIRPDHLALLPYDTGACSWKDGCGSPRINKCSDIDHAVNSTEVEDTSLPNQPTKETKELTVNGKQLGKALQGAIAANAGEDGTTTDIVNRLAVAADITVDKVQALIKGELDFAPRRWLNIFAVVLDVDPWDIFMAASDDNASARYNESEAVVENNSKKDVEALTETHTEQDIDKECLPCQKSLKTKVLEILSSIGIGRTETKEETIKMNTNADAKKVKIDALIASDKNQFTETNREWLTALSDEQIAAFEPAVKEVAVTNEQTEVKVEVKADSKVAETKTVAMSKEEILATLGVAEEDLKAAKSLNDEKKAARNAKIDEIAAIESCQYSKAELANFSDALLDKTLDMLQLETPFRVTASSAKKQESKIQQAPSILLVKPGEAGVDYAVQTARNKARVN